MPGLTVGERIILYVGRFQMLKDNFDVPFDVSQDGIAGSLGISRAHAAIELKKLRESGVVEEKLAHIKKGKNKRKVYFLSPAGETREQKIREYAEREGLDLGPLLDIRRSRGPELYASLSDEHKIIIAGACVFRKPFRREALPESSAMILPVDRRGMVDLPPELRREIEGLLSKDERKKYHSRAADYWLAEGDYRERLYHLIMSGRTKEAEMLVASKSHMLLKDPDEKLLQSVAMIESPSERYALRVRSLQGELARILKDSEYCSTVCAEMQASSDPEERAAGLEIQGKMLRDLGQAEKALEAFEQAGTMSGNIPVHLELERAETLILLDRQKEAWDILSRALRTAGSDPESLDRLYFLAGMAHLKSKEAEEALRYLSKGLAITKAKDRRPWYSALSEAYAISGMVEKAREFADKANPPKKWGES